MTRDLRFLRHGGELRQGPGAFIGNLAVKSQSPGRTVDHGRLAFRVEGVEAEIMVDLAFGECRREFVGMKQPGLNAIVPARYAAQHAVNGVVIRDVAAGQQGQRAKA